MSLSRLFDDRERTYCTRVFLAFFFLFIGKGKQCGLILNVVLLNKFRDIYVAKPFEFFFGGLPRRSQSPCAVVVDVAV